MPARLPRVLLLRAGLGGAPFLAPLPVRLHFAGVATPFSLTIAGEWLPAPSAAPAPLVTPYVHILSPMVEQSGTRALAATLD